MFKKIISAIGIIIIISLISCNDIPEPSRTEKNIKHHPGFTPIPDSVHIEDLTASLIIYKISSYHDALQKFTVSTGTIAAFYNESDYSVDAGLVTLNSDTISRYSAVTGEQDPDSMFSYSKQPYTFSFNGGSYTWLIDGSNDFSSFSLQMNSPDHEATITSPSNESNISINQSLTVYWQTYQNEADKVKVAIISDNSGIEKYVDDTGSCTFSSNELLQLGTGSGSIEVSVGNFKLVNLSGKYALGVIVSSHQIKCTLTP